LFATLPKYGVAVDYSEWRKERMEDIEVFNAKAQRREAY
jgi:hypothetical protein